MVILQRSCTLEPLYVACISWRILSWCLRNGQQWCIYASRATRNVIITTSSSLSHSPCLPLGTQRRRPSSSLEAVRTMTCARYRRRDTGWNLSTAQNLHKRARGQRRFAIYTPANPARSRRSGCMQIVITCIWASGGRPVAAWAHSSRLRTTLGPSNRCVLRGLKSQICQCRAIANRSYRVQF
jgi:hypothetical protein